MDWHQLWKITSAADNVPIVLMLFLIPFYCWYAFRQAFANDRLIARLNAALVKGLNTADTRKRLEADGAELMTGTPEDFARLIRSETEKWSRIIKAADIKPE